MYARPSQHVVEHHGKTLLPHYLGMYRITVNDQETYKVVMKNIFSPKMPIHKKYDLKVRFTAFHLKSLVDLCKHIKDMEMCLVVRFRFWPCCVLSTVSVIHVTWSGKYIMVISKLLLFSSSSPISRQCPRHCWVHLTPSYWTSINGQLSRIRQTKGPYSWLYGL